MNDTCSGRSDLAEGVDVGHDIVSAALLLLGGNLELIVLDGGMSLHLLDSLVGDGQSELYNMTNESIEWLLISIPIKITSDVGESSFYPLMLPSSEFSYLSETRRARSKAGARSRIACEGRRDTSSQYLTDWTLMLATEFNPPPIIVPSMGPGWRKN